MCRKQGSPTRTSGSLGSTRRGATRPDQPPLHRQRRGRQPARRGPARAPGRLRARPAGERAEGVLGASRAQAPARRPRRRRDRRMEPAELEAASARSPRSIAFQARWPAGSGAVRRDRERVRRGCLASCGRRRGRADLERRLLDLPGIGPMKARSLVAILGKRFGVRPPGWEEVAPTYPTLGDVDSGGARGLPGEEARPQGGAEGRRAEGSTEPEARPRRRGARSVLPSSSPARSRFAGSPACPRRSA